MSTGKFGGFAQHMSDIGLVFDMHFTEEELLQLQKWSVFDRKIMEGISSLPGGIQFPTRTDNGPVSANSMAWQWVNFIRKPIKGQTDRHKYILVPLQQQLSSNEWTLDHLIEGYTITNLINGLDGALVPEHLVVISLLFLWHFS
jgi:hypothetical protein